MGGCGILKVGREPKSGNLPAIGRWVFKLWEGLPFQRFWKEALLQAKRRLEEKLLAIMEKAK